VLSYRGSKDQQRVEHAIGYSALSPLNVIAIVVDTSMEQRLLADYTPDNCRKK
jgi:hypothetical protein